MFKSQNCTVKACFEGKSKKIFGPPNFKYREFIKRTMQRFSIPTELENFIEVSSSDKYIFDKDTFENYLLLYPSPEMTFQLEVNMSLILGDLQNYSPNTFDFGEEHESGILQWCNSIMEEFSEYKEDQSDVRRRTIGYSNSEDLF